MVDKNATGILLQIGGLGERTVGLLIDLFFVKTWYYLNIKINPYKGSITLSITAST